MFNPAILDPSDNTAQPNATFAWRAGKPISKSDLLNASSILVDKISQYDHVINICGERLNFSYGFLAALLSQSITVLPPNSQKGTIRSISKNFENYCVLVDSDDFRDIRHAIDVRMFKLNSVDELHSIQRPTLTVDPEALAAIAFTSGSTGEPKAQEKKWRTLFGTAALLGERFSASIENKGQINVLATVPSQHMYGLEMTLLMALQNAWSVSSRRPFFPTDIAEALHEIPAPRILVTTPVHLRALLGSGVTLPKIEKIVSATAPLSKELAVQAELMFDTRVYEIYGCTEAGSLATRRTAEDDEWHLLEGIKLSLRGNDTYVSGKHLSGEALLNDVISMTDTQYFRLQGRCGDLINVAGKRASLAELNEKLLAISGVDDGVVFMNKKNGEKESRTAALVVAKNISDSEIMKALSETVDPVFLPRPLKLVDALPRSATGKLPTKALMEFLQSVSS
ncbi:MAG: AMP-binding protein [Agarilytica sp.]